MNYETMSEEEIIKEYRRFEKSYKYCSDDLEKTEELLKDKKVDYMTKTEWKQDIIEDKNNMDYYLSEMKKIEEYAKANGIILAKSEQEVLREYNELMDYYEETKEDRKLIKDFLTERMSYSRRCSLEKELEKDERKIKSLQASLQKLREYANNNNITLVRTHEEPKLLNKAKNS